MSDRYPGGIITKTPVTPTGPYQDGTAPGIWTLEQQAYWQAQGLWPTAGNTDPGDSYYKYVTMLLTGDGTNGAQNNTFLDSSSNAFTITRNGNTTQGSFSPYGSLWSNYFNGSSDYLNISDNTGLQLGTSDFTLEMFLSLNTVSVDYGGRIFMVQPFNNGYSNILVYRNGSDLMFLTSSSGSGWDVIATFGSVTVGSWNHIAVSRSGNTFTGYLNGTQVFSTTNSTNLSRTGSGARIAQDVSEYFYGYVSNLRLIKGSAIYSGSTITVPTSPLTAVSGTSLLTCQSNRFIDNSSNNASITVGGGTPSVQRFSPFNPTAAYSTATIGGSGYFDGSGDYLALAAGNSAFDLSSGDSTIEGWYYPTAFSSNKVLCGITDATTSYYRIYVDSTGTLNLEVSGQTTRTTSATMKLNAWNYFSISKNGSGIYLAINGTVESFGTYALGYDASVPFLVGARTGPGLYVTGYMSDVRVVKGTALRTSTYTPPTAPLTTVSGTSLLCNFTNAGIPDSAMMNDLETVGNAQVSTTQKKYGTASVYIDGSGSTALTMPPSPNLNFGTGDFTLEFWMYTTISSGSIVGGSYQGPFTIGSYTTGGLTCYYAGTTVYIDQSGGGATAITFASSSIPTSQWNHIAITRASGSLRCFVNGTQVGSTVSSTVNFNQGSVGPNVFGARNQAGSAGYWNGYFDDVRITNGYARYTANFTPPTAAFYTY